MSYQVLARKWRPHQLEEMVGQEPVLQMLTNALKTNRLHHAYLFTGTRGVGKTTLARILAKCLNCEKGISPSPCGQCSVCEAIDAGRFLDLIEVDAASRTKVEDTREILDNVQYAPSQGRFKIYLIDEVHMLSGHSFNALLKTLEEPPAHVKFLLATTDPKRLPITVLSRCLQFHLKRVPPDQIERHLDHICVAEKIPFEPSALTLLAEAAEGSLRDALSLLDQTIVFCQSNITTAATRQMLGSVEEDTLFLLLKALAKQDGKTLLTEISKLAEIAPDFNQVLESLLSILHQISLAQIITDLPNANGSIQELSKIFSAEEVQLYYQIALIGRRDLPLAPNSKQGFEMVMLRMLAFQPTSEKTSSDKPINKQTTPKEISPPSHSSHTNWATILSKLNLSGMAYALAANCTLSTLEKDKIILSLSPTHTPMLNKKLSDRIEEALTRYFDRPIHLEIQLAEGTIDTPVKQQQENQTKRLNEAAETLKNDSQVQKIMHMFNATLDEQSIKTID